MKLIMYVKWMRGIKYSISTAVKRTGERGNFKSAKPEKLGLYNIIVWFG